MDGQEDGAPAGIHVQACLEEPSLGGDAARGLAVVAQGHFDEQPVAFRMVLQLGVHAQDNVLAQHVVLGGAGGE